MIKNHKALLSKSNLFIAKIFCLLSQVLKGRLSRIHKIYSLPLKTKNGSVLSLLVENLGRINYGSKIHDFKVILPYIIIYLYELAL